MRAALGTDTFENIVATFVDVGSLLLAYEIGVSGFGVVAGLGYAVFDALIVVWMRKRIATAVRWINPWKNSRREQRLDWS